MDKAQMEAEYLVLKEIALKSTDINELENAAKKLDNISEYRDSSNYALYAGRRVQELKAQQEAFKKTERENKENAFNAVIKHNKKVRNIGLVSIIALFLLSAGVFVWSTLYESSYVDAFTIIFGIIAAVFVEALFSGLVVITTILNLIMLDTRKKVGKVMVVLSRIFSIPGILVWGVASLGALFMPFEILSVWGILSFALNLISFVVPFFKKKIKEA